MEPRRATRSFGGGRRPAPRIRTRTRKQSAWGGLRFGRSALGGRREGCPWEARSWRDVVGRGRPPTASVLGLLRGADAAHALPYPLPGDPLPSGPSPPIAWRCAPFVAHLAKRPGNRRFREGLGGAVGPRQNRRS